MSNLQVHVPAPDYEKGYYKNDQTKPTKSEQALYQYYLNAIVAKDTVGDKVSFEREFRSTEISSQVTFIMLGVN
jgi:hypothetical protein